MAAMKVPLLPMAQLGLAPGRVPTGAAMRPAQVGPGAVGLGQRLPRPSGLLMFESAARQRNFTLAARELRVTQSAVSQQVRALEQQLGVTLFIRLPRGLQLTAEGSRLQRAVSLGFEHIADAVAEIRRAEATPAITIGVTFAIATFWLVPRLPQFRALHPDIDVHVIASDRGFDTVADRVETGIAFGTGRWAGFRASLLLQGDAFPVCSPAYLRGRKPLRSVEQLFDETLLSLDDGRPDQLDWPGWFAGLGVAGKPRRRQLKFNSHPLLMQAAIEGQGVAVGWSLLTDDLIAGGKLVRPLDAVLHTEKGYYLVASEREGKREIAAFRNWLQGYFQSPQPGTAACQPPRVPAAQRRPRVGRSGAGRGP
jgi:LysR family transcriptional regulator, glycine cleavage system transcriptional activator